MHVLTCLLARRHVSAWMYMHAFLCTPMCEWVTLASESVHVCDDYKSAFPRRIALVSSVAAPL